MARVRSPTVAVVEVVPGGTTARDYIAFKVDTDDREVGLVDWSMYKHCLLIIIM